MTNFFHLGHAENRIRRIFELISDFFSQRDFSLHQCTHENTHKIIYREYGTEHREKVEIFFFFSGEVLCVPIVTLPMSDVHILSCNIHFEFHCNVKPGVHAHGSALTATQHSHGRYKQDSFIPRQMAPTRTNWHSLGYTRCSCTHIVGKTQQNWKFIFIRMHCMARGFCWPQQRLTAKRIL